NKQTNNADLMSIAPNPISEASTININLPEKSTVSIKITDSNGITNFITAMLLSGCLFIGCNNKNENLKALSQIEVKAQPKQAATSETQAAKTVFTGDDIVSYNGKTGEIQFKQNVLSQKNQDPPDTDGSLDFYVKDQFLFSLYYRIISSIDNGFYSVPLIYHSFLDDKYDKYYIVDGYPWGITIDESARARTVQAGSVEQIRKANAEKILSGWRLFVDELKKEGKYIEN
ncbi:MAG: hypothetical protein LLF95_06905, partial [Bacteroidales bacterium]|nr:hypothetical protein [Bacteroidales bacterium]